jgi:hypothetical protein
MEECRSHVNGEEDTWKKNTRKNQGGVARRRAPYMRNQAVPLMGSSERQEVYKIIPANDT